MKFIVAVLLIALLSVTACIFLPWWSIAAAAMLVAVVIPLRPFAAFMAGFIALFLLWSGMSYAISSRNLHLLSHKMSMLVLSTDNPVLLVMVTGLVGAFVAGFAALTGSFVRYRQMPVTRNP